MKKKVSKYSLRRYFGNLLGPETPEEKKTRRDHRNACQKEWYAKNKGRLNSDPVVLAARKIASTQYYQNHKTDIKKDKGGAKSKNRTGITRKYHRHEGRVNWDRNSESYKKYMREYQNVNKERLAIIKKVKSKEWITRQVNSLTDTYILSILTNKKNGLFDTREQAMEYPEIIELKRNEILICRIKRKIKFIKHDKDIK